MTAAAPDLPTIDELGRDLLQVSPTQRAISLALPFLLAAAFFPLAAHGWWLAAMLCPVLLSFLTYASSSHDLVHRNIHLPAAVNEPLLCAMELLCFRSGHAYRTVHLHHHSHFPEEDDLEGAAARMNLAQALLYGFTLQYRLWWFALQRPGSQRRWAVAEGSAVLLMLAACAAVWSWTHLPGIYAALMIAGSWIYPFATAYLVHNADATDDLHQTRLFRGRVLSVLAMEHLYHLEHHLYPQVPHQNWPELARRLDPYFARQGLQPVRLLF